MYKSRCFSYNQIEVTIAADLINNDKRAKYKGLCRKFGFLNKKSKIIVFNLFKRRMLKKSRFKNLEILK